VTMGEMAGYLPETVMPQVLALLAADNALLLRTSLFIDEDAALRRLADLISDAQAIAIMQDADRHGLWPVALYLMQRLDAPRRARFGDAHNTRGAVKQAHAESRLQLGHRTRHSGRGLLHAPGCAGKATVLHNGKKQLHGL